MISTKLLFNISPKTFYDAGRRNIGILAPLLNKVSDPIQKLFLEKVQEFRKLSSDGKPIEASPEIEKERKAELDRVAKTYGGGQGVDMKSFPSFKFEEPKIDPISQQTQSG